MKSNGRPTLVHDTFYGRARAGVMELVHRADDAAFRIGHARRRILFEAASPLSLIVFWPIYRRLREDDRLELWFTTCDPFWSADRVFGAAGLHERVVSPRDVKWRKFDAFINADFTNMTWLPRRTRRIHLFHGVAGKYGLDAPVHIAPVVAAFDRLLFANTDRLNRYIAAGVIDPESGQGALVGFPKVDCLVDGSLDRASIQARLGLDPRMPTVLYAPTWSPASSLNAMGEEIVRALARMGVNLIVKLHDRSYDPSRRGSGGIDWRRRLMRLCGRCGARLIQEPNVSPYLFVADLLVTDHSSVGFEFTLLDRPIVIVDCPELIQAAAINPQKVSLLRSAALVVREPGELPAAVSRSLADPSSNSPQRRAIAGALFYDPGKATERATQCIYEVLELGQPAPACVGEHVPRDAPSFRWQATKTQATKHVDDLLIW